MNLQRPFENQKPAVVEVVCGVQLDELQKLSTPHIGSILELYKKEGYMEFQEMPTLVSRLEYLHEEAMPHISLQESSVPPLPRLWFLNETSDTMIQLQRDRFVFNWTPVTLEVQYPGLDSIAGSFEKYLCYFEDFMEKQGEPIKRLQYELAYINHIPQGDGWENLEDLSVILNCLITKNGEEHFLNKAKSVNWRTSFQFSTDARLHVNIFTQVLPPGEVLQVEWIARGPLIQPSMPNKEAVVLESSQIWFRLFHEQIRQKSRNLFNEEIYN